MAFFIHIPQFLALLSSYSPRSNASSYSLSGDSNQVVTPEGLRPLAGGLSGANTTGCRCVRLLHPEGMPAIFNPKISDQIQFPLWLTTRSTRLDEIFPDGVLLGLRCNVGQPVGLEHLLRRHCSLLANKICLTRFRHGSR